MFVGHCPVDNLKIGEKITFAKLEQPTNLSFDDSIGIFGYSTSFVTGKKKVYTRDLKKKLSEAGYGGIDVDAVMAKYAQYDTYRTWYGKEKAYIKGYDTVGAMAEINRLIKEAYRTNLDSFKEAVGISSDSFANAMKEALSGGDVEEIVNDLFNLDINSSSLKPFKSLTTRL